MIDLIGILQELRPEHDFTDSEDFISDNLLDSFDIVTLVAELEERFSIYIDGEDVTPENFMNLNTLEQFLQSYLAPEQLQVSNE
jgi:acyl carrier protein